MYFFSPPGVNEQLIEEAGLKVTQVLSRLDGEGENAVDLLEQDRICLVINTPRGRGPRSDGAYIRRAAGQHNVPLVTTVAAALAAARGMRDLRNNSLSVRSLQDIHDGLGG